MKQNKKNYGDKIIQNKTLLWKQSRSQFLFLFLGMN
jgi:hypothetical protein